MTDHTPMTSEKARAIAELEVRRYFDHYLTNVFPRQLEAAIEKHDGDREAHGGVERRFMRVFWIGIGAALATGSGLGYIMYPLMAAGSG